jgi:hypothetical protein
MYLHPSIKPKLAACRGGLHRSEGRELREHRMLGVGRKVEVPIRLYGPDDVDLVFSEPRRGQRPATRKSRQYNGRQQSHTNGPGHGPRS